MKTKADMSKKFILGMVTAMALTSFQSAMAAGVRIAEGAVAQSVKEAAAKATRAGALRGVDYSNQAKIQKDVADGLAKDINLIEVRDLQKAQGKVITVDVNGKNESISIGDLAKRTLAIRQTVETLRSMDSDEAAKSKLASLDRGSKSLTQILAISFKTSASADGARNLEQIRQDISDVNKFINEFTNILETGSAKEIDSYSQLADAMIKSQSDSSVTVDQAYDRGMKSLYGSKAEAKKQELRGCQRG